MLCEHGPRAPRTTPQPVGVPACRLRRRRPRGHGRRPRPGHGAGGLPARVVPDAGGGPGRRRPSQMAWWSPVTGGSFRSGSCGSRGRCGSPPGTSRSGSTPLRRGGAGCCGPVAVGRLDRRADRRGVHRAAPARLGPLGRGLARRSSSPGACTASRSAGLFAGESMFSRVRDASKVALMGLVDLLARRARRPTAARHPVADPAPGHAGGGGDPAPGVPGPAGAGPAAAAPGCWWSS